MRAKNVPFEKYEYEAQLKAKGAKSVGEGSYCNVWTIPNKRTRVLKVGICDDTHKNDAYLTWIRSTRKAKSNPHVPKVYDMQYYRSLDSHTGRRVCWYTIELERLYPTYDLDDTLEDGYSLLRKMSIESTYEIGDEGSDTEDWSKPMLTVHKLVYRLCNRFQHDVHDENVMWRPSRNHKSWTLVVTDPVA